MKAFKRIEEATADLQLALEEEDITRLPNKEQAEQFLTEALVVLWRLAGVAGNVRQDIARL